MERKDLRQTVTEALRREERSKKVQELYARLDVEARPFYGSKTLWEKTVNLDNGWIQIVNGTDDNLRNKANVSIVNNNTGSSVRCELSPNEKHYVEIMHARTTIRVNSSTFTMPMGDFFINPKAEDEDQIMSVFLDWIRESIDKNTVTEPPYKFGNDPNPIPLLSPRAPTHQLV